VLRGSCEISGIHKVATPSQAPALGVDPRFTGRERQPGLDLLRALAIVVVVVYHAGIMGFPLSGEVHRFGWIGVDLFFVLSGYLIGGQLLAPLARAQRINLGTFFARRALRIMPAYFFVLAVYFLFRRGANIPRCRSPSGNFCCRCKTLHFMAGRHFHMRGRSPLKTNFTSYFLFSYSYSIHVHARP